MRTAANGRYRFGAVELDVQNLVLTVAGETRPLEPKSFRLLQFLVENRGRVVSKEEILAAIWQDTFVTDNALTRAITQVRKALNDDPKQPTYIETVPTVGYRFLGEIKEAVEEKPPATPPRPRLALIAAGLILLVVGGVLVWRFRPAPKPLEPGFLHTAQFSYGEGLDVNATFSPDGKMIAFASDRSGSFEIYVRPLEPSAREIQLTSNGNENMFPSFSPDGQFIVFSATKAAGLYRIPALGGAVRRLTEFGTQPVWSPDGRQIVFLSHTAATLSTTDYYWPRDSSMWLVSADGGTPRQITFPDKPVGGQTFPSWSPDGKEIRFVNYAARKPSLWTYRLSDGALENRFSSNEVSTFGSASFSRDGRRMYFVRSNLNGDIGIWQMRLDPRTLKPEGAPEPLFRPSLGVPRDLSLSPDGTHMVFSAVLAFSQLFVQPMNGQKPSGEAFAITHGTSYRYAQAKWFPDGKGVVCTRWNTGQAAQIWQVKLDGSPAAPVSPDGAPQFFSYALRDGQSVAYTEVTSPARLGFKLGFKVTSLSDGSVRTLAEINSGADQANFSPDGSEVVFHDVNEPVQHVWKMNFKTGKRTQMTFGSIPTGFAHFSPDAKWISLQVLKQADTEIGVMPSAGGTPEILWKQPGLWFNGGWAPDGEHLLIAGNQGGCWALYALSRRTRKMERLTRELPARMYLRYPEWSPDGKKIVYEFNESKGNVFLAELP
ncbi:MAG TPA: winged helix-turn-helix domain-containing protein [Bryobacteraceae bacterium]|nr:winged helix-turn-helix domain-containing protein [Bryobacteraceae bacterium]